MNMGPLTLAPNTMQAPTVPGTSATGAASHKGLAPLIHPGSVLFNYNRLMAEAQQMRLDSIDHEVLQLRHLQEQHLKRRQAAVLAGLSSFQGGALSTSSAPDHLSRDIIGMGIYIPKNEAQSGALSKAPSFQAQPPRPSSQAVSNKNKFLMIGKPLSAPPALAKKIHTRATSRRPLQAASRDPPAPLLSGTKRRKLNDIPTAYVGQGSQHSMHPLSLPMMLDSARHASLPQSPLEDHHSVTSYISKIAKTSSSLLSAEELEIVMAAQALNQHSPKTTALPTPAPLRMALRAPPALHF